MGCSAASASDGGVLAAKASEMRQRLVQPPGSHSTKVDMSRTGDERGRRRPTSPSSPRVSYLVRRVERGVRAELDAALRPLNVTASEYTTLSVLAHRSGLSSAQLARRAFVSAQAMNLIVVALERNGWIERSADPDHNRVLCASLTRAGKAILAECNRATSHVEELLLSRLSSKQADGMREALELCAAALYERVVPGAPTSDS